MTTSERQALPAGASEFLPEIRRARFGTLTIYEISEGELDLLERGSGDSLFLNFAISLTTLGVSLVVMLLTTTIASDRVFASFVAAAIVSFVGALLLFILWRRSRASISRVADSIRRRMTPEGDFQALSLPGEAVRLRN